jgi:hypothetical protein
LVAAFQFSQEESLCHPLFLLSGAQRSTLAKKHDTHKGENQEVWPQLLLTENCRSPFLRPSDWPRLAGKTVFTSDHALKLEWIPDWIAIVGSGYIGLEFSDVYTALGSDVSGSLCLLITAFTIRWTL